jgi:hypothetical protein
MSPSSLALPVKAKDDIWRLNRFLLHFGQSGRFFVSTLREKKLKIILQSSQKNS